MKTRSVKSSQVSGLSIVTGGADGPGDARSSGNRHGPRPPRLSQAEAAPGPPLIAKVTGRLAVSAPSRTNARVAISALGARLSASLKRIAAAIALKRRLRPGSSIACEVVAAAGKGFWAASGAWAWTLASFCRSALAGRPCSTSGVDGSKAATGNAAAKLKRRQMAGARIHFREWASGVVDGGGASAWITLVSRYTSY